MIQFILHERIVEQVADVQGTQIQDQFLEGWTLYRGTDCGRASATNHGENVEAIQLVLIAAEQIVDIPCHRSWRTREGDSAWGERPFDGYCVWCHRLWMKSWR